tara:strand:- start:2627 stop:3190 length:564 start_codon:yes stop_codon:yes gene_type:complete
MIRITMFTLFLVSTLPLCSCTTGSGPYHHADPQRRDTAKAERLTREAADWIETNPITAEKLLREALAEDIYYGPAHNNLGVLFIDQGRLYQAAAEFEWARKLMPGNPEPRLNLGLTLEHGGRIDEAIQSYEAALALTPEHLDSVQALVRCQIRYNLLDSQVADRLKIIAMRGTPEWSSWARQRLLEL